MTVTTEKYSAICGYTQKEIENVFEPEIAQLAEKKKISHEECVLQLKKMYDGYHFTVDLLDIYNPFSTMSAFVNNNLGSYWFATGTPTFLVKMMQKTSFPLETLEDGIDVDGTSLEGYRLNMKCQFQCSTKQATLQ